MSIEVSAAYAQLFALGFFLTGLHCVGMCGPILCGLQINKSHRFGLLIYQLGRSVIYLMLGALAGILGASVKSYIMPVGSLISLAIGILILLKVIIGSQLFKLNLRAEKLAVLQPGGNGAMRPMFFGLLLGFMPCMLTFWALGLAATTASPIHGALIMLCLVLMTTPALFIATSLSQRTLNFIKKIPYSKQIESGFFSLSGLWLILVGLSGSGFISHQHLSFKILSEIYMIMLW